MYELTDNALMGNDGRNLNNALEQFVHNWKKLYWISFTLPVGQRKML